METEIAQARRIPPKSRTRICCPHCGNDTDFFEIADGVVLTTRYLQNSDGSFIQESDESQVLGEIKFFCGECNQDLSEYHNHFLEMLF
ncbi:MAG TPA: hypothetical protein DEQ20_02760 [Desulfobulbaceae bacterium]|jgi:hypothetical protein|nr:MAG: hypothetical protein A2520_04345 [Deltaproteobacteria bacterium RIFOXYD12_FULL_53_23]HCC53835.1 hypothetical protein [Desulfobulbaceae bacterium]